MEKVVVAWLTAQNGRELDGVAEAWLALARLRETDEAAALLRVGSCAHPISEKSRELVFRDPGFEPTLLDDFYGLDLPLSRIGARLGSWLVREPCLAQELFAQRFALAEESHGSMMDSTG